jgi:predicted lysophospholipase L1 biosynthesis ABC-type transport system permease subunit
MSSDTRERQAEALDRVRRRVTAIGFFAVASHGVFGLIGVSYVLVGQDRNGDAVLLTLMSGVVALIVCAATRAILGRRPFSLPWSIASIAPTVAAYVWLF